jgi:hypothetical protein
VSSYAQVKDINQVSFVNVVLLGCKNPKVQHHHLQRSENLKFHIPVRFFFIYDPSSWGNEELSHNAMKSI